MKIKFEWENIFDEYGDEKFSTYRAKVIGGWVVRYGAEWEEKEYAITSSMVFVPDPNHEWEIE